MVVEEKECTETHRISKIVFREMQFYATFSNCALRQILIFCDKK
jgi:hypothetical protein